MTIFTESRPFPSRPLATIRTELEEVASAIAAASAASGRLTALRESVQRLAVEAICNPMKQGALQEANTALLQHEEQASKLAPLAAKQRELQQELAKVEQEERRHIVAKADARLDAAKDDFVRAAKAMVRAWRQMARVAEANGRIPGASRSVLSANLKGVIVPVTYQGDLEQILRSGPLPWEQAEREEAAEQAKWEMGEAA